ncbi:head-tail connector protein [Bacillus phage 043JT007]|nr:head-tail connector protein [Bacillus phage 043JT007]
MMFTNENSGYPYDHNNPEHIKPEDVDKYTLADYGFTVDAVKANHFGMDVTDPRTGEYLPDAFYESKIEAAIAQAEKRLDIVILPRILTEHHDFYRNDYQSYMYIHTHSKPILQLEDVRLEYGGNTIYKYPARWWRVNNLAGHVQMLPNTALSGGQNDLSLVQAYSSYPMISGLPYTVGNNYAPQMFHVKYIAGMLPPKRRGVTAPLEMHPDLWNLVIKMALKEVFEQWGRLILGAGIASMSVQMDGISQSIDTTQSAMYGGASADIVQLNEDIEGLVSGLKSYYGINLGLI